MFSWRDEIFQDHVVIKVEMWRKIASAFRLLPLYTLADLEGAEQSMLSVAMDSIDTLKKMKGKRAEVRKSDHKCMWQVRVSEGGDPMYICLYHHKEAAMEEGKIPTHTWNVKTQSKT